MATFFYTTTEMWRMLVACLAVTCGLLAEVSGQVEKPNELLVEYHQGFRSQWFSFIITRLQLGSELFEFI